MISINLGEIGVRLIEQLCSDARPESQTLEFKKTLPAKEVADRVEFAKDICAFANADGGDIVFGVAEVDGTAAKVFPIKDENADAAQRRLTQTIENLVEPRLVGLQFKFVEFDKDAYVLVPIVAARTSCHCMGSSLCGGPAGQEPQKSDDIPVRGQQVRATYRPIYAAGALALGTGEFRWAATGDAGAGPAPDTLEEITIIARRRTENVQNVPIAVTALQGDQLAGKTITSMSGGCISHSAHRSRRLSKPPCTAEVEAPCARHESCLYAERRCVPCVWLVRRRLS